MKFSNLLVDKIKDKVEITKQQQAEIQTIYTNSIVPHENHILFEVNLKTFKISLAEFEPPKTLIYYHEALEMFHKAKINKVDLNKPQPVTKAKVIKKENCIYISALNINNVKKILIRDFNIDFNS